MSVAVEISERSSTDATDASNITAVETVADELYSLLDAVAIHVPACFDDPTTDFSLVRPTSVVIDTAKLAALGWESTPHDDSIARTVDEHLQSDRTGRHHGPNREEEQRAIDGIIS